jgi:hypothetical protein
VERVYEGGGRWRGYRREIEGIQRDIEKIERGIEGI